MFSIPSETFYREAAMFAKNTSKPFSHEGKKRTKKTEYRRTDDGRPARLRPAARDYGAASSPSSLRHFGTEEQQEFSNIPFKSRVCLPGLLGHSEPSAA